MGGAALDGGECKGLVTQSHVKDVLRVLGPPRAPAAAARVRRGRGSCVYRAHDASLRVAGAPPRRAGLSLSIFVTCTVNRSARRRAETRKWISDTDN